MVRLLIGIAFLFVVTAARAQESVVITADNASQLTRVASIDYASAPEAAGRLESGGFAMNADGTRLAVRNREDSIIIWNYEGELLDVFSVTGEDGLPDTVLDLAFNRSGTLLGAIVSDGAQYAVAIREIESEATVVAPFINSPDVPLRLWFEPDMPFVWLEVSAAEPGKAGYTARMPYALPGSVVDRLDLFIIPEGPDADTEAFARLGRIAPPYAVTSTQDGLVKLWNLQTGEVIASAQVEGTPVFGGINARATHLAWRDPDTSELHLLNFETGEDRLIAPLDGAYVSYIIPTLDADLILGVHVADEPIIAAWDVETGERINLGEYRACNRTPDMARLSADGTTLVIGCDSGLEIWRIHN